eukprot:1916152-Rhodomonas_salina.2
MVQIVVPDGDVDYEEFEAAIQVCSYAILCHVRSDLGYGGTLSPVLTSGMAVPGRANGPEACRHQTAFQLPFKWPRRHRAQVLVSLLLSDECTKNALLVPMVLIREHICTRD